MRLDPVLRFIGGGIIVIAVIPSVTIFTGAYYGRRLVP
jgi:hypothetical protein